MEILTFDSPKNTQYHFGEASYSGENNLNKTSEIFHSDSLYAALIKTSAMIDDMLTTEFVSWLKLGKLRLSSTFFMLNFAEKSIYFLPKPIVLNLHKHKERKILKKISYLSWDVYKNGNMPEDWLSDKCKIIQGKFVISKSELQGVNIESIFANTSMPKVQVRTLNEEGNFYQQSNVQLISNDFYNTNYYAFINHSLTDEEYSKLKIILRALADSGIGAELSTGAGHLNQIKLNAFEEIEFSSNQKMSLSMFLPADNEKSNCKLYKTKLRGGKNFPDGTKANFIEMLQEGAIIEGNPIGKIEDLGNENNPYLKAGVPLLIDLPKTYADFTQTIIEEIKKYEIDT